MDEPLALYDIVASALRLTHESTRPASAARTAVEATAHHIALGFAADNPMFERIPFLAACGLSPKCPNCGLPTSRWDEAGAPPAGWYCDGPNDSTAQRGCFTLTPDTPVAEDEIPLIHKRLVDAIAAAICREDEKPEDERTLDMGSTGDIAWVAADAVLDALGLEQVGWRFDDPASSSGTGCA